MRWFPVVGWAERGGYNATGHGNSVPRFHVTWGTGPGRAGAVSSAACARGGETRPADLQFRHRVNDLTTHGGAVDGVHGDILEPSAVERGQASSRVATGDFDLRAQAVIVTSGGIGANHDLVRQQLAEAAGRPRPRR